MRDLPFDDATVPLYTMGQAADMLGLRPAFLRRLDEHGVVTPARSAGRQRRYSREQIETIRRVLDLMNEGLTLAGVRRVLALQHEINQLKRELADVSPNRSADDRLTA